MAKLTSCVTALRKIWHAAAISNTTRSDSFAMRLTVSGRAAWTTVCPYFLSYLDFCKSESGIASLPLGQGTKPPQFQTTFLGLTAPKLHDFPSSLFCNRSLQGELRCESICFLCWLRAGWGW
jgi:hypothetical protein